MDIVGIVPAGLEPPEKTNLELPLPFFQFTKIIWGEGGRYTLYYEGNIKKAIPTGPLEKKNRRF